MFNGTFIGERQDKVVKEGFIFWPNRLRKCINKQNLKVYLQLNSLEGLLYAILILFLSRCFSSFTSIAFLFLYRTCHRGRKKKELVQYLMLLIIKMRSWKLKSQKFKPLQKLQEMTRIAFAIPYCMRWGSPGAVFDKPSLQLPSWPHLLRYKSYIS